MDKVMTLSLCPCDLQIPGEAVIDLPAQPYVLKDALERIHAEEGQKLQAFMEFSRWTELKKYDTPVNSAKDVFVLNAIAAKVSQMTDLDLNIASGMLKMQKSDTVPLERVYDILHSVECCHYIPASDDYSLGKFYFENGFLPETENLPDNIVPMLDFEWIGHAKRCLKGGVFLDGKQGYIIQHSNLIEAHRNLPAEILQPDYAVLLELGQRDSGAVEVLKFPMPPDRIDALLVQIESQEPETASWRCMDCKIPALRDAVSTCESLETINDIALSLQKLTREQCAAFKALVEVKGISELEAAREGLEALDQYALTPEFLTPIDVGRNRLDFSLGAEERELLEPYVNLYAYGDQIIEQFNMKLTSFGALERRDGQPILGPEQEAEPGMRMR